MARIKDLTGITFGLLTALRLGTPRVSEGSGQRRTIWVCQCSCGTLKEVEAYNLKTGHTSSCGCLWSAGRKHGMSQTPIYDAYVSMKQRCLNANHPEYKSYGGRGIKVCDRWLESFENFYADMGAPPEGLSLDREDNDGDYTPENCRWATPTEQSSNRRGCRVLTFGGRSQLQSYWADEVGLKRDTLSRRLSAGWTIEQALTTPSYTGNRIRRRQVNSAAD